MDILVLDTIHGGTVIGDALKEMGHNVTLVDVYRGDCSHPSSISPDEVISRQYDLLIHPVHLDPEYRLLREIICPTIDHHEAVRWIVEKSRRKIDDGPSIEITGARGKTTTASALAILMERSGILHTSRGTFRYPGEDFLTRMSITPASLLTVDAWRNPGDWLIAEISLGFSGACDLAVLTSDEDYLVAGGKRSAKEIKNQSGFRSSKVLVPPGVSYAHNGRIDAGDLVQVKGAQCSYSYQEKQGSFSSPLFLLEGYRVPLQLAAAAALLLGYSPDPLMAFTPLAGRMKVTQEGEKTIVDNASTGACLKTTKDAISLISQGNHTNFTLVIGQECRAVCENFPTEDIITAITEGKPSHVVLVAGDDRLDTGKIIEMCQSDSVPVQIVTAMQEGIEYAMTTSASTIIVSVKTWR